MSFYPISEEDYGSADYILEALNENIFKMEQFNKARGGSGLSNVILYGVIDDYIKVVDALDGLVAQVSVLSVPTQISGFENFEFTVFANAIGALYRRNKDTERINLLEVDQMQGKGSGGGVSSLMVTAGIIAVASIVAIGAITAVVKIRTSSLESDIKEDEKQIDELNEKLKGNELLKVQLTAIQAYDTAVKDERAALTSWPKFDNNLKKKIDEAFKKVKNAEYKGLEYDLSEGKITLTEVTVKEQEDATDLVRALKDVKDDSKKDGKFFTAVSFDGFRKDEDNKYSLGDLEVTINLDAATDEEAEDKKEDTKEEAAK